MARIGIDVRKIGDFGIGRYIERLVFHLSRTADDHTFLLFGPDRALERCTVAPEAAGRFIRVRERSRSYSLTEHITLPLALRCRRVDLYHGTHYVLPQAPLPRLVVSSVHDLIHLRFPEYLPSRWALRYARHFIGRAAGRSDAVITGSEQSRRDLLEFFPGTDARRVHVIPYGVDDRFAPAANDGVRAADEKTLHALGVRAPFILFVGNFKPHKNLYGALAAFDRCTAAGAAPRRLVLAGRELASQKGLETAVRRMAHRDLVQCLGRVPDDSLPALYRRADLFLFPSLYEGFGLPPLEAMACGTPVVASDRASLPEVLGDAALLTNPEDPDALSAAMLRVLTDDGLRRTLREKGPQRASRFEWERTARRTFALYDTLISEHGAPG